MAPKFLDYNATLVARVDMTSALATFRVRLDEPLEGPFTPGQYLTIGLNNEANPELGSVRRPMSIASAPEEGPEVEFYIRWVAHPESENPLTWLLWKTKAGDRLSVRPKAAGTFTLEHTVGSEDRRLKVLVAAGTGLAPFISMARHRLLGGDGDLSSLAILHGASYPADLGYRSELESLVAKGLKYLPTVSRPHEAEGWTGAVGRVEDFFREERLAGLEDQLGLGRGGLTPDRAAIFICGLQGTIGSTVTRLLDRGFVPENRRLRKILEVPEETPASLFYEQYDTTPVVPVDDEAAMADLRARLRAAIAR
jgi:ferredoxin--NADP+ reductase